jgi:hypothetical protein
VNNPDHISESLETIFWFNILKFFDADPDLRSEIFLTLDPGSGMEKIRIRGSGNIHPRSATLAGTNAKSGNVSSMKIYISKFLVGRS